MQSESPPGLGKSNWVLRRLPCVFVLSGGLGNQLFSYAAGLYFSKQSGRKVIFDLSDIDLLRKFHTSSILELNPHRPVFRLRFRKALWRAIGLIQTLFSIRSQKSFVYGSPVLGHDIQLEKNDQALLVRGHYQTYKYLVDQEVASEMRNLCIKSTSASFCKENAALSGRHILGVHARLGNYSELQESFGSLSDDYFRSAIRAALAVENSTINYIYLYSDDIEKANQDLNLLEWGLPVKFIGKNSGLTDEETLVLMSKSDSLVISNSTFSWWAAALGKQDKRVYAPTKWFRGLEDPIALYPSHWQLVDSSWK